SRRDLGLSESRQIRPKQSKLSRHPWHPAEPYDARLVVAMNEHDGLGLAPGFTEPVLAVEQLLRASIVRRPALRQCALRRESAHRRRNADCRRRSAAEAEQISTGACERHRYHLSNGASGHWDGST